MNKMPRLYYITRARSLTAKDTGSKTMMVLHNGAFIGYAYLR